MRLFFSCFFLISLQFVAQSVFVGLKQTKYALFFSLFRKVIIIIPLTLFLPYAANLGTNGVFLTEPISDILANIPCYLMMLLFVQQHFKQLKAE